MSRLASIPANAAPENERLGADLRTAAGQPLAQRLSSKYWEEHTLLPLAITGDGAVA